jgi:hypothetical protein
LIVGFNARLPAEVRDARKRDAEWSVTNMAALVNPGVRRWVQAGMFFEKPF